MNQPWKSLEITDDLRLSLELLIKAILENNKSLENQLSDLGRFIKDNGGSKELGNMFQKLVEYFTQYQNSYIKHNDQVIEEEIEFIFEMTSSFKKIFIRIKK
jgi:light-regulated signal transduction histidine kinase (bacteriophytochrome)